MADYSQGPLLSIAPVDAAAIAEESRRDQEDLNSPPSEPLIGGVLVPVPLPQRPTPSPAAPTPLALAPTPTPTLIPTSAPEPTSPPPEPQPTPVPPPPPTEPVPTPQPTTAPTTIPPTEAPPTVPATDAPPTIPPTSIPPTEAPPTIPPTEIPPTIPPTEVPPTDTPPTSTPLPPPVISFSASTYTVNEDAGTATITVVLDKVPTTNVVIDYATANGTADGSDYTAVAGPLTFVAGQTANTFTIPITNDTKDEVDETIILTLSNPQNGTLGAPSSATLTIVDTTLPPQVQFTSSTYSVSESGGSASITVVLTSPSDFSVTVTYSTGDGTATAGSDYTNTTNILTFSPGQTSANFSVPIISDTVDEADETINLTLTTPNNATLGTPSSATLTIIDDDARPFVQFISGTYSVVENVASIDITAILSGNTTDLTVTVPYTTSNLTASAGSDYTSQTGILTFPPGQTSLNFTVPITNDGLNEFDETVALALGTPTNADPGIPVNATLTILDDDVSIVEFDRPDYNVPENIGTATITVTLTPTAPTAVTVAYTTIKLTATDGTDYTTTANTLNFAPGQTTQTFTVPIVDDIVSEPEETFLLTLSNPTGEDTILGPTSIANVNILTDTTDSSTCTFETNGSNDPSEPDIGPPDGEFRDVACNSAFIVDLGTPVNTTGDSAYDFVYYEYGSPDPPTTTTSIRLDWVIIEVSETITGPWTQVFYWGDTITDTNSNIGAAGYNKNSSAPTTIETDNQQIPVAALYGTAPYKTGITIDIDAIAPATTYRYLRFSVPPGGDNDSMQIDAIETFP